MNLMRKKKMIMKLEEKRKKVMEEAKNEAILIPKPNIRIGKEIACS